MGRPASSQWYKHIEQTLASSPAFSLFLNSLHSKKTKENYTYYLSHFLRYAKQGPDDILALTPKQLQAILISYIVDMRDNKNLSTATMRLATASVQSFLLINDIYEGINWKKVKKFMGEHTIVGDDRPYTREEVAKLVTSAHNLRDKAVLLMLASTGLRVGGLSELKIKNLTAIDKYQLYQVDVYKKSREHYITFCTPECRKAIDEYLDWRSRLGEKLTPESPLFRQDFDIRFGVRAPAVSVTSETIKGIVERLRKQTAIVPTQHLTESTKIGSYRSEIKALHGFRKYFASTLKGEGVFSEYVEKLLGHDLGLRDVYSKPTALQLLEGNGDKVRGYIAGINQLTIDDTQRFKSEIKLLKKQITEQSEIRKDIETLKLQNSRNLEKIRREMLSMKGTT